MTSTYDIFYKLKLLSKKWNNYFEVYDELLKNYVGKNPKMLEIGVAHGGSLELWLKYFDNEVDLYAVDINKDFLDYKFDAKVDYACVDQSSTEHWNAYLTGKPNFDIIVDDGSHDSEHQILTLITLFSKLNDGGIYVVEDTHTSYWPEWGGGLHKQGTFVEFAKQLIDLLHAPHIRESAPPALVKAFVDLKSVTFHNSMVVLEKGITRPSTEAVSNANRNPVFSWG
jgi:hypothetical protein